MRKLSEPLPGYSAHVQCGSKSRRTRGTQRGGGRWWENEARALRNQREWVRTERPPKVGEGPKGKRAQSTQVGPGKQLALSTSASLSALGRGGERRANSHGKEDTGFSRMR